MQLKNENKFNVCKDHRNKKEVLDPMVKDLISDKIWKQNKSKADLTVENWVYLNPKFWKARPFFFRVLQGLPWYRKVRIGIEWWFTIMFSSFFPLSPIVRHWRRKAVPFEILDSNILNSQPLNQPCFYSVTKKWPVGHFGAREKLPTTGKVFQTYSDSLVSEFTRQNKSQN